MKAVYPGTFDPFTNGHLDVIKRGLRLFGSLTVAVAQNPKKALLFSISDRVEMIQQSAKGLKGVEVKPFSSLLIDFVRSEKADVVLRGLRETSDFPQEFQLAIVNRLLDNSIETVFVMTDPQSFYITSSIVKEIAEYGGDVSGFVPGPVLRELNRKFKQPLGRFKRC